MNRPKRPIPALTSDEAAERFVATADLSEFDLSGFRPASFEFEAKAAQLNMRVPRRLLDAVKERARARGMPYTRYIRLLMEQAVAESGKP
jgi:predicted DNA binding CopG/RHH family protein